MICDDCIDKNKKDCYGTREVLNIKGQIRKINEKEIITYCAGYRKNENSSRV